MLQKLFIILAFLLLGIFFHFIPNKGIPLNSDVTWIFRLQTVNDANLQKSIPSGLRLMGAFKQNFWQYFIDWYQLTGRWNIFDIASFRLLAIIGGNNADIWRLFYIIILSGSVSLFYLISKELKIPTLISLFLSLGLFFYPLDAWTDHKTAEPKALLFLLIAIYSSLKWKHLLGSITASLAMLFSILSKESFIIFWLIIPAISFTQIKIRKKSWKDFNYFLFPHLASLSLILFYVIFLKLNFPQDTRGYILTNANNVIPFFIFFQNYIYQLFQGFIIPKPIIYQVGLLFLTLLILIKAHLKIKKKYFFEYIKRLNFILLGTLIITIVLHGMIYYLTGRNISGRYVIPANYIALLTIVLLFKPILIESLKNIRRKKMFVMVVTPLFLIFIITSIKIRILPNAAQNRLDQDKWQGLIEEVSQKAPTNSHIVLKFAEPYMIETAQSLEANTLLRGRYDLIYHLEFKDTQAYQQDSGFLKYLVDSYNKSRKLIPPQGNRNILYVKADRKGGNGLPYLNYELSLDSSLHP